MRIIAGRLKGRLLCSFSAPFIRPMTDRVKTSVFNVLYSIRGDLKSCTVLDLFSGTGNLALEAISRGAKLAYCIDINKKSIELIKKNADLLKVSSQIKTYRQNVFSFLESEVKNDFDIIFADPPFQKKWGQKILDKMEKSAVFGKNTLLVLELPSQEKINIESKAYLLLTKKFFGDKQVCFFQKII